MVSPELQIYKCFGCGESGDVIAFLQNHEGMEFYEALKFLADKAGIKLKPVQGGKFSEKEKLIQVNNLSQRLYQYLLLNHKEGKRPLKYLTQERGLKMDTIKKFGLGYSPRNPELLAKVLTTKKKVQPQDIVKTGLAYQRGRSLHDRFSGRVIFPLQDARGNVIGFSGRLLPESKSDMGKYINTPDTPLYQKSRVLYGLNFTKKDIKKEKEAVVVEGEFDLIAPWQAGVRNIVAIKGSAFTREQVQLLNRFTQKLVLALDADFAGNNAARKGIAVAQEEGMEIKVVDLKEYKDPDEMARKNPKGLIRQIKDPVGVWDYLIDMTFKKYEGVTGSDKAKISREVVPILISIPDSIVQAHYIEVVAKKLGVPTSAVVSQVTKAEPDKKEEEVVDPKREVMKDRRYLLEERLMLLIFRSDPKRITKKEIKSLFLQRVFLRIIESYEDFVKKEKKYDVSRFAKELPKELHDVFSELMMVDISNIEEDEDKTVEEIKIVIREIKEFDIRKIQLEITQEMKIAEKKKDVKEMAKLQKKFAMLSNELNELEENEDSGIIL